MASVIEWMHNQMVVVCHRPTSWGQTTQTSDQSDEEGMRLGPLSRWHSYSN